MNVTIIDFYQNCEDDRTFIETEEVLKVQVGNVENPRTVVAIY